MNVVPIQQEMDLGQPTFSDFWLLWPQKIQRKDAERVWTKLPEEDQLAAIVAVYDWRRVWLEEDCKFTPNVVRWLRGERWQDELPRGAKYSAPVPMRREDPGPKTTMPEHVRSLIAKLRGK